MAKFFSILKGLRILVVDPHADSRDLLSILFGMYGVETIEAASAEEALNILNQTPPDLLISEVRLPGENGYSLMQKVKSAFTAKHTTNGTAHHGEIPAIALTSFARDSDRACAIAAGFSRHVSKPCNLDELLDIVIDLVQAYCRVPSDFGGASHALCCEGLFLKTDSENTPHF